MKRRLGARKHPARSEQSANTYQALGASRRCPANATRRYSGFCKLYGEEHETTLTAANNYASTLIESKALRRSEDTSVKRCPWRDAFSEIVMRPRLERGQFTRKRSTRTLAATLDDLREAATTLEETNGPRGACSVARIRSQRTLSGICGMREGAPPRETPPAGG